MSKLGASHECCVTLICLHYAECISLHVCMSLARKNTNNKAVSVARCAHLCSSALMTASSRSSGFGTNFWPSSCSICSRTCGGGQHGGDQSVSCCLAYPGQSGGAMHLETCLIRAQMHAAHATSTCTQQMQAAAMLPFSSNVAC